MPFYSYFEEIFIILQAQHNNIVVMAGYIAIHVLVVILRLTIFLGYRGHNMWLSADLSKPLNAISEANGIRSQLLRRIANDYIVAAKKNAPRAPLDAILDKHVLGLSVIGWRYTGISLWTDRLETGLIFIGIILMLIFPEYAIVYGILAVAGFVLLKLVSAIYDCGCAKQLLVSDIKMYVEREIGQFFAGHTAGAILQFKDEVVAAIDRQAALFTHLQSLAELPRALEYMQKSNDRYALHHEAFLAQTQIIKDTQAALEESLAAYEDTLQNMVQAMGGGMGTAIQMHGQKAAETLTAALQSHVKLMGKSNRETIAAVTSLIEQLNAQSRDISANLRVLHERMEESV